MRSDAPGSPEYYSRWRDVLSATRYALVALVVAVGFAVVGIAGRVWAFIPAAIAAVFAVADALLAWRGLRAAEAVDLRTLLSGGACRGRDVRDSAYGIDPAVLPDDQEWHYIRRDCEHELREAINAALSKTGPPMVMLCGETKSGKTRLAVEALRSEELQDAWLVVPRNGASVELLLRPGALPRKWNPLVVWLDDLERYTTADADGLHEGTLRNLECDRPVLLLATEGGLGAGSRSHTLMDPIEQLKRLAASVTVHVKLSDSELERAGNAYADDLLQEIEQLGIGRRMAAMGELEQRLARPSPRSREGIAVVRAAIDWRRAGAVTPLHATQLEVLYRHYLPNDLDPGSNVFEAGLGWAREPLPGTEISLLRSTADETGRYQPDDLVVEMAAKLWPPASPEALRRIVSIAEPADCFQLATTAYDSGDSGLALELLARAEHTDDPRLSSISAFNTGVLLAQIGDTHGAETAYRRADLRGSMRGAFNLGQLLRDNGDLSGAEAAYRRADERGSPEGAVNLGTLLEQKGDLDGARTAYTRAKERGSVKGASNLRRLLPGVHRAPERSEAVASMTSEA